MLVLKKLIFRDSKFIYDIKNIKKDCSDVRGWDVFNFLTKITYCYVEKLLYCTLQCTMKVLNLIHLT